MKYNRWVVDKVLDRRENCNAEEDGSAGIDCDSPLTAWTLAPWYSDPAPPVYASALEFKIPAESMYASNGKSSPTDLKMGSVVLTEYGQTPTNTEGPYDPAEKVVFLSPLHVRWLDDCGAFECREPITLALGLRVTLLVLIWSQASSDSSRHGGEQKAVADVECTCGAWRQL